MNHGKQITTFKKYSEVNVDGHRSAEFYQDVVTTHKNIDTGELVITERVPTALWGQTKEMLVEQLTKQIKELKKQHQAAEDEIQNKIDEITAL